ncbi:thiazole synthase [Spirochaetota bacterium]|nr:thiazole synthase [Spirochaetota bacterium]
MEDAPLIIAGKTFSSRLIMGSGKFENSNLMKQSLLTSGAQMITIALKRIDIANPNDDFLTTIKTTAAHFLPNTAGARTAHDALRIARLARAASGNNWIKLEVTPNPKHLLPDPIETLTAAAALVKEDFIVLPYINADPILAKRLEELGCATVMPLGAPIGSNRGLKTLDQIKIIIAEATVPVVVDAGIGAPSHAALAMELGADAVLVNTAIATADDPSTMAQAFKLAVCAGRLAYLSHKARTTSSVYAHASSPLPDFLNS